MTKIKFISALAALCLALPLAVQAGNDAGQRGGDRGEGGNKPRAEAGQQGERAGHAADAASAGHHHQTKAEREAKEKVELKRVQGRGADFGRCRADAQAQGLSGVAFRTAMGKCMNPAAAASAN